MVELKTIRPRGERAWHPCFNRSMVELKRECISKSPLAGPRFNRSMVELKSVLSTALMKHTNPLQSVYGRIENQLSRMDILRAKLLQSVYGRIENGTIQCLRFLGTLLQSVYGRIEKPHGRLVCERSLEASIGLW